MVGQEAGVPIFKWNVAGVLRSGTAYQNLMKTAGVRRGEEQQSNRAGAGRGWGGGQGGDDETPDSGWTS